MQNQDVRRGVEEVELENVRLRAELTDQWELNHSEHCSNEWPHPEEKKCCYPPPSILLGYSSQ
jgi:hypothetical protein